MNQFNAPSLRIKSKYSNQHMSTKVLDLCLVNVC